MRPALRPETAERLREQLPSLAHETVETLVSEVPEYAALRGEARRIIEQAVQTGVAGFIRLAERARDTDPGTPQAALAAAYELGRGEARAGRSMDALQAAYRIGARVSWRAQSTVLVQDGVPAEEMAQFAELVFAYIDELSASSVAGHADERETTGRVRELLLERLGRLLIEAAPAEAIGEAAERAGWTPPETLTAVILPESRVRAALSVLDAGTLRLPGDVAGIDDATILLVPSAGGARRAQLLGALAGHEAVVGPARPWTAVAASLQRAMGAREVVRGDRGAVVDTEAHLATLITQADPEALADLRRRALAPLADLRPAARERLEQTLRSWLLHQGRRDDVAADLVVHPQTVRYRMTQVRDLYGDRLQDPSVVLELVLALGVPP